MSCFLFIILASGDLTLHDTGSKLQQKLPKRWGKVGENPAALRAAVFLLFAKNRAGVFNPPPPSRAKVKHLTQKGQNYWHHQNGLYHHQNGHPPHQLNGFTRMVKGTTKKDNPPQEWPIDHRRWQMKFGIKN